MCLKIFQNNVKNSYENFVIIAFVYVLNMLDCTEDTNYH